MSKTWEKTYRGFWWEPSNLDVQWYGKVRWRHRKSPRLRLHYKSAEHATLPPENVESILGYDASGAPLSLLRAGCSGTTSSGFLSKKTYHAGHLLKGLHVARLEDIRIHRVDFWLQYLGAWVGEEGFARDAAHDDASRIEYRRPDDREYPLSSNLTLKVCHSSTASSKSRQRSVGYDIFLSLEQQRGFNFNRAFHWIDSLRNLIHFTCLRKVYSMAIKFENSEHRFQLGEKSFPKQVEVYNGGLAKPIDKDPLFFDFVFTFKDVENRFAEVCSQWLRFSAEYREPLGCYTSTIYGNLSSELRLISLTQGLEAFHERRYKPASKSEASHFMNRIRELCEKQGERMVEIVGNLDDFATAVRDTRHYYTHHDPAIRQKGKVYSGTKLWQMTFHLQYLFRLCVLTEFNLAGDPHRMLKRQIPSRFVEYY